MFDYLLTQEQTKLQDEVRDFIKWVPRQLVLDMDKDIIKFPKEFLREAGRRNLMGCRYPKAWGGRDMDWVSTGVVMEEVGTIGYELACVFGVGAELVCDAIIRHGTDEQKEKYVKPLLRGDIFAAECLTEPRGGSDFFGATSKAEDMGDHFLLNGQKRFIVGGEGADYFLVYAKTNFEPGAKPQDSITAFVVDRGPGVETKYLYNLMGCRGGGTARLVFHDVKVQGKHLGQAEWRLCRLQYHDDPRETGNGNHDPGFGTGRPGDRHPLYDQAQGFWRHHQQLSGGQLPGGGGGHAPRCGQGHGIRHMPGR